MTTLGIAESTQFSENSLIQGIYKEIPMLNSAKRCTYITDLKTLSSLHKHQNKVYTWRGEGWAPSFSTSYSMLMQTQIGKTNRIYSHTQSIFGNTIFSFSLGFLLI